MIGDAIGRRAAEHAVSANRGASFGQRELYESHIESAL